jgi:putative CocE/NonD family hydrolase
MAWLRRQPWFTGRLATIGASYLGFTQWALLADPPPELTAAVIVMGPHDFGQAAWGTGSFALNDFLTWSFLLAHQENDGWVGSQLRSLVASRLLRDALHVLPLGDAVRTRLQQGAPWYESWLQNADLNSDFWRPVRLDAALDRVEIPVLLIGGWQDVFLNQTLEQYRRIRSRDVNAELIIGPWTHRQAGGEAIRASFGWLARHLADTPDGRPSPVRVFVTGGVGWRDLPDWPPASREMTLYLHPGTALADEPPPADAAPSRFTYDPADPTPTIGGRLLSTAAGYRNDSPLALRDDVLSFTGPVLTEDVDVMGTPYVELTHSTDIPYADVFVRISEVDGKGRSRNVSDGFLRLAASRSSPLRVDLDAIAHRFRAGNRIRLLVAGGSHPRFARNLGTEESMLTSSRFTKATHVVAHGSRGVSRLVLPVASPAR